NIMKNIAVLVSGGGTNLQALIDAQKSGKIINGHIALVLSSSPDAFALTRAQVNGIETRIVDRKKYKSRESFSAAIAKRFDEFNIDLVVFAGFNFILTDEFLGKFENRIMNVHPALIPSFCGDGFYGLHTHEAVLASGVKLTGATVHFVTAVTDGGPIILQKAVRVMEKDTPEVLQRRVMEEAEWQILPEAVSLFCQERLKIEDGIVHIL
ncbi:MAG: phosphoribosylglycinamide formyltransferase, partial [Methanomicrobium sp.]|nr:phosphoribosylglycinamide formyltransferase [Methanomicrobium sp.]